MIIETLKYRGFDIEILPDEDAPNPLKSVDIPLKFAFFDRPELGNCNFSSAEAVLDSFEEPHTFKAFIFRDGKITSGMNEGEPEDGYIFIKLSDVKKVWPVNTTPNLLAYIDAYSKDFAAWGAGKVYGYRVFSNWKRIDFSDSSWNYFDIDHCVESAKENIDITIINHLEKVKAKHAEKLLTDRFIGSCWAY